MDGLILLLATAALLTGLGALAGAFGADTRDGHLRARHPRP